MTIEVRGLHEFSRELKALHKDWPKALRKTNLAAVGPMVASARSNAASLGGVAAAMAGAIKGYAGQTAVGVGVPKRSTSFPAASVAFWGSDRKTGWYGADQFAGAGGLQHPRWVGNSWRSGVRGQGPYAINDAVADHADRFVDSWAKNIEALAKRAFPN